jgi:hypothetical protein
MEIKNRRAVIILLMVILSILIMNIFMLFEIRSRQIKTTAKIDFINNYCLE